METTPFFFTNFPEDATVDDLWSRFGRFGRVGEVYIPKKLDKQGRRFGFVKFRDVDDIERFLPTLSDIWIGSFKLRINRARFRRDEDNLGKQVQQHRPSVDFTLAQVQQGVSFKEVLAAKKVGNGSPSNAKSGDLEVIPKVVWEVEVEEDKMALLRGAYVGFLLQNMEVNLLQQFFMMDGYHGIKVTTLGHSKVLLSSNNEGEIKELIGSVGWWCQCFERFVPWSSDSVSSQREVWLNCYGVPLSAWGMSLFRTIRYKFGKFIGVDSPTREMQRGDIARVKVSTASEKLIDSSMAILVLNQKFTIRVVEDSGGWQGGGCRCHGGYPVRQEEASSMASIVGGVSVLATVEGDSVVGSDGDMSVGCQEVLGVGNKVVGKGEYLNPRMDVCQVSKVAGKSPNLLGNSHIVGQHVQPEVNGICRVNLNFDGDCRDEGVVSAIPDRPVGDATCHVLSKAMCLVPACDALLGGKTLESGGGGGHMPEEWEKDLGPPSGGGVDSINPSFLRTRKGDLNLYGPAQSNPFIEAVGNYDGPNQQSFGPLPNEKPCSLPAMVQKQKRGRPKGSTAKKTKKSLLTRSNAFLPMKQHRRLPRNSHGHTCFSKHRKSTHKGCCTAPLVNQGQSDSIHCPDGETQQIGDPNSIATADESRGIELEVVLPCSGSSNSRTGNQCDFQDMCSYVSDSMDNNNLVLANEIREGVEAAKLLGIQQQLEVYGKPEEKRRMLVTEILALDNKSETLGLTLEEVNVRKQKFEELWSILKSFDASIFFRSRSKWLKAVACYSVSKAVFYFGPTAFDLESGGAYGSGWVEVEFGVAKEFFLLGRNPVS
ncbi:hypothetical protein TSUD_191730 [Trifolium subterraneum]|uniref:RRM domain-containing protein n=1 Tax=Trifolium subterraneum TaxID=3900 RepID=A0A2Z6LH32_TRISU|nr:hypothetical protein TSUD_191730 [Trifolium subterraneum]